MCAIHVELLKISKGFPRCLARRYSEVTQLTTTGKIEACKCKRIVDTEVVTAKGERVQVARLRKIEIQNIHILRSNVNRHGGKRRAGGQAELLYWSLKGGRPGQVFEASALGDLKCFRRGRSKKSDYASRCDCPRGGDDDGMDLKVWLVHATVFAVGSELAEDGVVVGNVLAEAERADLRTVFKQGDEVAAFEQNV